MRTSAAGRATLHAAFAALAVGIRATGFCGRRNFAVTHSNFALIEIFDAERIAESAGQFLKFQNFAGVGLFVDAMQGLDGAVRAGNEPRRDWRRA